MCVRLDSRRINTYFVHCNMLHCSNFSSYHVNMTQI